MRKYVRGTQCSAFGCNKRKFSKSKERSDSEGSSDEETAVKRKYPRTFHCIPKNKEKQKEWLIQINREDWQPGKKASICSDHFVERDMDRTGCTARLREGVIPTRFKMIRKVLQKEIKQHSRKTRTSKKASCSTKSEPLPNDDSETKPLSSTTTDSDKTKNLNTDVEPLPTTKEATTEPTTDLGGGSQLSRNNELATIGTDTDANKNINVLQTELITRKHGLPLTIRLEEPQNSSQMSTPGTEIVNHEPTKSRNGATDIPSAENSWSYCSVNNYQRSFRSNSKKLSVLPDHNYACKTSPGLLLQQLHAKDEQVLNVRRKLKTAQQRCRRLTAKVTNLKKTVNELRKINYALSSKVPKMETLEDIPSMVVFDAADTPVSVLVDDLLDLDSLL